MNPEGKSIFTISTSVGEIILILLLLLSLGTAFLMPNILYILVWILFLLLATYSIFSRLKKVVVFKNGFQVLKLYQSIKTINTVEPFSNIKKARFAFASIRGEHRLTLTYAKDGLTKKVKSVYRGIVPKKELEFLKHVQIEIEISPPDMAKFVFDEKVNG